MTKNVNRHFVAWVMGITTPLIVAGVMGLARTSADQQIKIAILWEHCPECREALAVMPHERTPSIFAAFGFSSPVPAALEQKGKKERREKIR